MGKDNVVDKFIVNGAMEYEYVCQFTGFGFVGSACLKNEPSVQGSPTEVAFDRPDGVTVDREGDVYISDIESKAIYEFNSAGEDVQRISVPENVERPGDIALDSSGDIYVAAAEPEEGLIDSSGVR